MDVTIIIVNYNTKELLRNCLSSIYKYTEGVSFEIIVSDNGSTDGSVDVVRNEFPDVILIENNANLGFGAANNKGLAIAKGKYVFYLNSDTLLLNNAVKMFFDFWENSEEKENIGALGGILLDENLDTMHSGGLFPTYASICKAIVKAAMFHFVKTFVAVFGAGERYRKKRAAISLKEQVESGETEGYITGADLFVLNGPLAEFDENFFMYYEETDLQLRMKRLGLKRIILDGPRIQHLTRKLDAAFSVVRASDIFMQDSALYYSRKNLGNGVRLLRFIIMLDRLNPYVRRSSEKLYKAIPRNNNC